MVRVTGFEPAASWSQTTRATSCATPGDLFCRDIIQHLYKSRKGKNAPQKTAVHFWSLKMAYAFLDLPEVFHACIARETAITP